MASAKEIRGQIKATQNTAKITKAMEMVAASKMRKAQVSVVESRAYAEGVDQIVANLMQAHPEYKHPFLVEREEIKKVAYLIVSTDKGLCGGLNSNAFRALIPQLKPHGENVEIFSLGRRGAQFARRVGLTVVAAADDLPDNPGFNDIIGVISVAIEKYISGELDEVYISYNEFVNTMTQAPKTVRLLPCPLPEKPTHGGYWDYIYEPDSHEVLDGLLRRYVESLVYHAVLENKACEQSARMVAMKSATDNAKDIVKDLSITYNKARQASITQELAEICAGAAAAG
ncbi:MAG: F0F1 ATP synthase subunit gamma [Mariprofundaceae bacterium]